MNPSNKQLMSMYKTAAVMFDLAQRSILPYIHLLDDATREKVMLTLTDAGSQLNDEYERMKNEEDIFGC
jgi:hypothetical protein